METLSPISFKQARLNLDKKLIFLDNHCDDIQPTDEIDLLNGNIWFYPNNLIQIRSSEIVWHFLWNEKDHHELTQSLFPVASSDKWLSPMHPKYTLIENYGESKFYVTNGWYPEIESRSFVLIGSNFTIITSLL